MTAEQSGTGSEEFITSSSEFQDTKLVPSSSSALVSYPSESAGSYLEFDSGKLRAVVSDDFASPSELALPTQQSVYDLVQGVSGNSLQGAYDLGSEIEIEDVADGAVTIKDSSTNNNNDDIFKVTDSSDNNLVRVDNDTVELGGDQTTSTRVGRVDVSSDSAVSIDCGDLGTSRFFVSMLHDLDLFQIGRFDDVEDDYLGFQFSSDGITAHDDIHGTGIEYQALTDIENSTPLSLMHKQYIIDNSIMLSDTTFTDGVSRVVTGEDDSDL